MIETYWHMWCLPPPAVVRALSLWLDLNPIITEQGQRCLSSCPARCLTKRSGQEENVSGATQVWSAWLCKAHRAWVSHLCKD